MTKPHILIIGSGPAGLGAAFKLTHDGLAHVTVIDQNEEAGGLAGSFNISGINVDYGSHRLHSSCDPEILNDIKCLLGNDLLRRPRHGRIRLCGKWIHFPLKPVDLAFRLPPRFSLEVLTDIARKVFRRNSLTVEEETFASVLEQGLGKTIFKDFYSPYSMKIWGLPPEILSSKQAHRRISANSLRKMFGKVLSAFPGFRKNASGKSFYYPRNGFGQITGSLFKAAAEKGVEFHLGAKIKSLELDGKKVSLVSFKKKGQLIDLRTDYVWSTLSIPDLVKYLEPSVPPDVIESSKNIEYRSMVIIYVLLEQERFSEYDAHYFPEKDIPITRISEPKNYNKVQEPSDCTVLCAELPCSENDLEWSMTNKELGEIVCNSLNKAGIPVESPVKEVITRRLKHAYPIYRKDYEKYFSLIDKWLSKIENLITFGRQGLFVHDNTHHALFMGYSAAKCLDENGFFDFARWQIYREVFETHVVED